MDMMVAWALSRFREIKGIWSRVRWLRGHLIRVLLAVSSATIAFVFISIPKSGYAAYFSNPSNYGIIFESIAVATLLFSGIEFWVRQRVSLTFEKLPPLGKKEVKPPAGEEISQFRDQAIIFNPAVNLVLNAASNPIVFNKERFEVHPMINEMLPLFISRMPEVGLDTSDDAKVRLFTDVTKDLLKRGGKVHLQETSYFRDRLSNTLANYRVRLEGREILNLRSETVTADGRLVSLKESLLSNQLGGSTLLVTSDATIVYLRQGNRVRENHGRLAPAGSGSFDLPPVRSRANLTFQTFARHEALRELREECGLSPEDVSCIQICGFGRYLYRNGKPEVFCIATTFRDSHSIKVPAREWDFQQRKVEIQGFEGDVTSANVVRGLDALRIRLEGGEAGFEQVSGPLYWNVLFARDYLAQLDQAAEDELFGGLS